MRVSLKLNVREICMLIKNLSVMKMPFLWAEEALFIGTHMQNYISKIHIELALEVYGKHISFAWNFALLLISLRKRRVLLRIEHFHRIFLQRPTLYCDGKERTYVVYTTVIIQWSDVDLRILGRHDACVCGGKLWENAGNNEFGHLK